MILQVLDAYGRLVNTDDLLRTGVITFPPAASVTVSDSSIFLSGAQVQTIVAGTAVLDNLKLVAEPGRYEVEVQSEGLQPALVEVRPVYLSITELAWTLNICQQTTLGPCALRTGTGAPGWRACI